MEPIKDTVRTLMKDLKDKRKRPACDSPAGLLKKVFSNKELKHLRFFSFKKGILNIKVDSSAWLYYLNLKKKLLLEKLSEKSKGVKDIRFSIGDITGDKQ
jgi:hypothetical protein